MLPFGNHQDKIGKNSQTLIPEHSKKIGIRTSPLGVYKDYVSSFWPFTSGNFNQSCPQKLILCNFDEKG